MIVRIMRPEHILENRPDDIPFFPDHIERLLGFFGKLISSLGRLCPRRTFGEPQRLWSIPPWNDTNDIPGPGRVIPQPRRNDLSWHTLTASVNQ